MRTTVSIDDRLLAEARRHARLSGRTLGQLVEAALRRELSRAEGPTERPPVPVFRGGCGPLPGVDFSSNRALAELLDDGEVVGSESGGGGLR